MAHVEEVMLTFVRICVAGHIIVMGRVRISLHASGQHLVGIGLMGYVINDFILRRIEYGMQGHRRFHDAQIRTHVTHMDTGPFQHGLPHFADQPLSFLGIQFFQVFRSIDFF